MTSDDEFEQRLWKALKSDRTVMLGLPVAEKGHARPMTALFEGERGPLWFFTATDNALAERRPAGEPAVATFASKSHDLFATLHGRLTLDTDRAVIDRLWNRWVAAWYEHGKDDPKLALLRFDPDQAEIWLDANSLLAGIKLVLGLDPKQEYRDKVAEISLR